MTVPSGTLLDIILASLYNAWSNKSVHSFFISSFTKRYVLQSHKLCSEKMEINPKIVIKGYIWKYYDTLHTQSREYVIDDVLEALYNWEKMQNVESHKES